MTKWIKFKKKTKFWNWPDSGTSQAIQTVQIKKFLKVIKVSTSFNQEKPPFFQSWSNGESCLVTQSVLALEIS